MSFIRVKDLADLEQKFLRAVQILKRMREAQIHWHEHYGYHAKIARQSWEEKADDFIEGLKIVSDQKKELELKIPD